MIPPELNAYIVNATPTLELRTICKIVEYWNYLPLDKKHDWLRTMSAGHQVDFRLDELLSFNSDNGYITIRADVYHEWQIRSGRRLVGPTHYDYLSGTDPRQGQHMRYICGMDSYEDMREMTHDPYYNRQPSQYMLHKVQLPGGSSYGTHYEPKDTYIRQYPRTPDQCYTITQRKKLVWWYIKHALQKWYHLIYPIPVKLDNGLYDVDKIYLKTTTTSLRSTLYQIDYTPEHFTITYEMK